MAPVLSESIDLGSGFKLEWTSWRPDRDLNPQYDGIPDLGKMGAVVTCRHGIEGSILFDHGEQYAILFPNHPKWSVMSWDPLTLEPSIACGSCHCHGWIRDGVWIDA